MKNPSHSISRRKALSLTAASVAAFVFGTRGLSQQRPPVERNRPAKLDLKLVQEFVGACHRDLEKVERLLKQEPGLANASFNLGGGDWERGLEAAAHMGRTDIADTLIGNGARKCVFWAAMAGEEEVVKAFVVADVNTASSRGVHNISLMAHAAISGQTSLTRYLLDKGARVDRKSLEHAVRGNRVEMVEWLVDNGANPAAKGLGGKFLYEQAESKGFDEIARFLRDRAGA